MFLNKLPRRLQDLSSLEDRALLEDHLRVKYYGAVEDVSMRKKWNFVCYYLVSSCRSQFIALFVASQAKDVSWPAVSSRVVLPRGRDELVHRTTDAVQSSLLVTWFLQFTENT